MEYIHTIVWLLWSLCEKLKIVGEKKKKIYNTKHAPEKRLNEKKKGAKAKWADAHAS